MALQSKQQTEVRDQVATAKSLNWRAMHLDKAIRAAVAREVAPLIADCERIRAAIDRAEAALPIVLDKRERAAARTGVIMRRARLECLLTELRVA